MEILSKKKKNRGSSQNLPKKPHPTVLTKSENHPTLEYSMLPSIPYKKLFTLDSLGHGL
jgi:hypothetical protein